MTGQLTVKVTKTFRGSDGQGMNGYILEDGKRIGMFLDEGCGGSMIFDFLREGSWYRNWAPAVWTEAVAAYKAKHPKAYEPDDGLVTELMEAAERARVKANFAKKGYPVTVLVKAGKVTTIGDEKFYEKEFFCGFKTEADIAAEAAKRTAQPWAAWEVVA